ncbi:MAG: BON domain-containing protein [Armatimonadetes bacterium]|nr:BON domain-containing protein [Armatimonadota bacterium]
MNRATVLVLLCSLSLIVSGCKRAENEMNTREENAPVVVQTDNAPAGTNNAPAATTGQPAEPVEDAAQSVGQTLSNAATTAKVKNEILLSPVIKNTQSSIDVETTDGAVILKGTVATREGKTAAQRIALKNAGNRTVMNQLVVKGAMNAQ